MLSPSIVKLNTGFQNIVLLWQYSAIYYGSNLKKMATTATKLDRLEELVLFMNFCVVRARDNSKILGQTMAEYILKQ